MWFSIVVSHWFCGLGKKNFVRLHRGVSTKTRGTYTPHTHTRLCKSCEFIWHESYGVYLPEFAQALTLNKTGCGSRPKFDLPLTYTPLHTHTLRTQPIPYVKICAHSAVALGSKMNAKRTSYGMPHRTSRVAHSMRFLVLSTNQFRDETNALANTQIKKQTPTQHKAHETVKMALESRRYLRKKKNTNNE